MKRGTVPFIATNGVGFIKPAEGGEEATFNAYDAYDPEIYGEIQAGDEVAYEAPTGKLQPASKILIIGRS